MVDVYDLTILVELHDRGVGEGVRRDGDRGCEAEVEHLGDGLGEPKPRQADGGCDAEADREEGGAAEMRGYPLHGPASDDGDAGGPTGGCCTGGGAVLLEHFHHDSYFSLRVVIRAFLVSSSRPRIFMICSSTWATIRVSFGNGSRSTPTCPSFISPAVTARATGLTSRKSASFITESNPGEALPFFHRLIAESFTPRARATSPPAISRSARVLLSH